MSDAPATTPPGLYELLERRVDALDAGIAQAKRDAAHFFVAEDRTAQRFERVLQRLWDLEQQSKLSYELQRAIAAKLGVTP